MITEIETNELLIVPSLHLFNGTYILTLNIKNIISMLLDAFPA